jgi:hypothetical protein
MERSVGIYQPFFKASLIERLDPGFIALDWMSNPTPALRELALHKHIAVQNIYSRHQLTGLLSPKFFAKTNLHSQQVYDWIADNPGHDIYLINGGPYGPYTTYNSVERTKISQGPAFESWMRALCMTFGLELPEELPRQTNGNRCSCNYWIASPTFWENWNNEVIEPIFAMMDRCKETDKIFAYAKYRGPTPVYNITFFYERLIDYYVARTKFRAIYYPWSEQSVLSLDYHPTVRVYLEEMIPLVDRIDAAGQWRDSDKAWLQQRFAGLSSGGVIVDTLAFDPADFDLPRSYPMPIGLGDNRNSHVSPRILDEQKG